MTRLRYFLLALAVSIAPTALAQETAPRPNIAGDWDVTVQTPQGTNTVLVTLKQDADKVDGLFKSPLGELPFTGTLVGNELKFNFTFPVDGQPLLITMTGKVDGEAIAGKADFGGFAEGDWSAKRPTANAATTATATSTESPTATATTTTPTTTTAGGFGGKWDVMLKTPGGDFPANATLTDEGGKVSGMFGSQMGEVPVTGTVEGKARKITMTAHTPQGAMNVTMTGDLDGDSIVNGKADIEGMGQMEWSAKRVKQ
jgi:hypothetical protein